MTLQENNNILKHTNRLSVQVSLTGLSFLVTDTNSGISQFFTKKRFSAISNPEEVLLSIQRVFSENIELQTEFGEIVVIYSNEIYAIVPEILFDESRASEYLKFNSKILSNDYIANDLIKDQKLVVVYIPYVNINNYFFEKYGSFKYYHGVSVLLKNIMNLEKYAIVSKVYLHVREGQFDCIILKGSSLQLCNTYSYRSPEDFIYYILFSFEQLGINPETVPVFLSGEIEEGDDIYKQLYTYIRSISFIENKISNQDGVTTSEASHINYLIQSTP
ncbi:DUF3822 family protein [Ulvibacter antarcticus]|uniref:Uncharacterized protein DUF3822 n=1 Tax=Ulvibacter antarcticus TaxID=442714 RepID=A0A3L9YV49_9FLAO|nr:DUF3822 family protein [Ulvibacter antarcticus]RMA64194.1 uncharacterized protein DUF3822 [Ulvibacter antarcticus]